MYMDTDFRPLDFQIFIIGLDLNLRKYISNSLKKFIHYDLCDTLWCSVMYCDHYSVIYTYFNFYIWLYTGFYFGLYTVLHWNFLYIGVFTLELYTGIFIYTTIHYLRRPGFSRKYLSIGMYCVLGLFMLYTVMYCDLWCTVIIILWCTVICDLHCDVLWPVVQCDYYSVMYCDLWSTLWCTVICGALWLLLCDVL